MATYVFDGKTAYTGTAGDDQFLLQDATVPVSVDGLDGVDYVRGGPFADQIEGGGGTDYVYGGPDADTIRGGSGDDVLSGATDNGDGTTSSDVVRTSTAQGFLAYIQVADTIVGGDGNDRILLTDASGDVAYGGTGDDTYVVALPGKYLTYVGGGSGYVPAGFEPTVVENAGEGNDTVIVSGGDYSTLNIRPTLGSYTLPSNVETLVLQAGGRTASGTGNELDNVLVGNDDTFSGQGGSNTLRGLSGNDVLYGLGGNDALFGDAGNDTLLGGTGADRMEGGTGNDLYSVDNATDLVIERAGEGYDEVYASVDFALTDNLETLFLTGTAVYGTGNSGDNAIIGNDVGNILAAGDGALEFINGAGGNDILIGGAGHDEIMGGSGADLFRFDAPSDSGPGGDFIYDFTRGEDHIQLNAASFGIGTAANPFVAGVNFFSGNAPTPMQGVSTLAYNNLTGFLSYDGDGTGANAPVVLALLNGVPNLQDSDFAFF